MSYFDVVVVGSGPSGVSAAFPLVDAGLSVLLVDGGKSAVIPPPVYPYLESRFSDEQQWRWLLGTDFHALRNVDAVSPKLRVPGNAYVFEGFDTANHIESRDFVAVGSLARGGLSNAWGCGVARLSPEEMLTFSFAASQMDESYAAVARRIGISGAVDDDLSDYFGVDAWANAPVALDALQQKILNRYATRRGDLLSGGFRLGRSRVAALTEDRGPRRACDLSGNCLWGCHRRALYSAGEDLDILMRHENFTYVPGFIVSGISASGIWKCVQGEGEQGRNQFFARKILLAAGTLATTRLALQALDLRTSIKMQSCPTAAFMLCLPHAIGAPRGPSFGLGQLSFSLALPSGVGAFGSLFSTYGLPFSEFVRYMPFRKRYGVDFLKGFLSSCVVGNLFLPGGFTTASLQLTDSGSLRIEGKFAAEVPQLMELAKSKLRKVFWKLGAVLMPMSFKIGQPGGDIHYAGTFPMKERPVIGETGTLGEVAGLDGVHIVDGACLSVVSEKSHTLTLMANADRIGRNISRMLKGISVD